jgi:hypothetical protein
VPLIVQFFTWYLVVPEFLPENIGMWCAYLLADASGGKQPQAQHGGDKELNVWVQLRFKLSSRCRAGKRTPVWRWG